MNIRQPSREYGNRAESAQFFILDLVLIPITRLLIYIPNFAKDAALYAWLARQLTSSRQRNEIRSSTGSARGILARNPVCRSPYARFEANSIRQADIPIPVKLLPSKR
jgi:hypothetical protein